MLLSIVPLFQCFSDRWSPILVQKKRQDLMLSISGGDPDPFFQKAGYNPHFFFFLEQNQHFYKRWDPDPLFF